MLYVFDAITKLLARTRPRSKPDWGLVRTRAELLNQDDQTVLSLVAMNLMGLRNPDRAVGGPSRRNIAACLIRSFWSVTTARWPKPVAPPTTWKRSCRSCWLTTSTFFQGHRSALAATQSSLRHAHQAASRCRSPGYRAALSACWRQGNRSQRPLARLSQRPALIRIPRRRARAQDLFQLGDLGRGQLAFRAARALGGQRLPAARGHRPPSPVRRHPRDPEVPGDLPVAGPGLDQIRRGQPRLLPAGPLRPVQAAAIGIPHPSGIAHHAPGDQTW